MPKTNTGMRRKDINPLNRSVDYKRVRKVINSAMFKLDKEDYDILYELYFKNTSIHRLARSIGVLRAPVRYRRDKALKQLKKIILEC